MTNELNLLNEPRIGDIVGTTNRMVIATTKKSERIPGECYAVWVAICHKEDEYHPYVVWDVIARPEGFAAEHGDYCSTIQQAMNAYIKRGGK
jgi:hypothetical protein